MIALVLFLFLIAIPWLNGVADMYIAYRFRRETKVQGNPADQTAFLRNWNAWKWSWVNRSATIVEAMPFFKKDVTETFGIKEDDGKVT